MQSLGVSGGFSGAVVWRVAACGNELCLRRWPQVHPSLSGLMAIHGLLQHVAISGFDLVPVPLPTRHGETHFVGEDHLWELTPWMPGEALLSSEPTSERLAAAMIALAQFHQAAESYQFQQQKASTAPSPGLIDRLMMLRELQQGELQQLWQATRTAEASDLRELAFELLEGMGRSLDKVVGKLEQVAHVPLPLQWCLRDVRHDQLLFVDEQVSGLLDFGAAAVDSVAGDVARLLGSLVHGHPTNRHPANWQAGLEAYTSVRPLSNQELSAIVAFDQGGLLCSATNWVRWLFVEGRSFPQIHALHDQLVWLRTRLQSLAVAANASTVDPLAGPTWGRAAESSSTGGRPHQSGETPWMHT